MGMDSPAYGRQIFPMFVRYDMRREEEGYTAFDFWTGCPVSVWAVLWNP